MQFEVNTMRWVRRLYHESAVIRVEAETAEEARAKAVQMALEEEDFVDWECIEEDESVMEVENAIAGPDDCVSVEEDEAE